MHNVCHIHVYKYSAILTFRICLTLYIENTEYQTSCWSGGLSDSARVHFAHLMKVYRGFISDHNY